ncbi:MAG: ABC transporter substrate-binding protein, partial [Acidimicrobiia bacterium]
MTKAALRSLAFAALLLAVDCPRGESPLDGAGPAKTEGPATAPLEIVFFGNTDDEARAKAQLRGAQMGAALAPKVLDREVKVTSAGPPSARALARAAGDSNVIAVITVGGESAIRDAAVALDEHLLPAFELGDDLYEAGKLRASVFQMRTPHSWMAWRIARYFGPGDRAYKKVAILREAVPSSDLVTDALAAALQERGVELIDAGVAPRTGEAAIAQGVEKLAGAKPQAVVLEGGEQFVSDAAKVMQSDKWRYQGKGQI